MTTSSSKRPGRLILTSVLWMTGFFFVASAPYGIHAEQQNPAKAATTFGYVTNANDNTISVIDTGSSKVVAAIPVGTRPVDVAITSGGTQRFEQDNRSHQPYQPFAYVTNSFGNTVSVIDTANNHVVATIRVGSFPSAVAFAAVTPSHHSSE